MTDPNLNPTEQALAVVLSLVVSRTSAVYMRRHGYPAPTDEQSAEIGNRQTAAVLACVMRMREPGAIPVDDPEALANELDALVEGIIEGAVLAVMGPASGYGEQTH